jgi:hypothetical protein
MGIEVGVYSEDDLKDLDAGKRKQLKDEFVRTIKSNAKIKTDLKKKLDPLYRRLKGSKT